MHRRGVTLTTVLVGTLLATVSLTGCTLEYRGSGSGIDGVLWRQIAGFEDPLSERFYTAQSTEPGKYLADVGSTVWNGAASSVPDLALDDGGVALYDLSSTETTVKFSVFISSGPRADGPTDDGHTYSGPSGVFTCYSIDAQLGGNREPVIERLAFDDCPAALVETTPTDAAFASAEVFDG